MKMNRRAGIVSATAVLALLATTMGAQSALAAVPAAVPAGVVSAASATEPAFTTVTGGSIMGAKADGVYEYKGVPYATADRYEKPEPASWSDTRKALVYGEVCPNGATTVNVHEFVTPSGQDLVENEDCLNLNVWVHDPGHGGQEAGPRLPARRRPLERFERGAVLLRRSQLRKEQRRRRCQREPPSQRARLPRALGLRR